MLKRLEENINLADQDNLLDLLAQAEKAAIASLDLEDPDIDAVERKAAADRRYRSSEKGRQTEARYRSSEKGQRTRERWESEHLETLRQYQESYRNSPENKARMRIYQENYRNNPENIERKKELNRRNYLAKKEKSSGEGLSPLSSG